METQSPASSSRVVDTVAAALVLGVAGLARFIALGRDPLTPSEAQLALEALAWVRGEAWGTVSVPLYPWWTGLLFFLHEANAFWARFWPALLGSGLALFPWVLFPRTRLRYRVALGLALALDPPLVMASRAADGAMWAVPWTIGAAALAMRGWTLAALLAALVALSAGPAGWWSLLVLSLAWGWESRHRHIPWFALFSTALKNSLTRGQVLALVGLGWILALGFGQYGPGWAAPFQSLVALVRQVLEAGFPGRTALAAFSAYQLPLILACLALTATGLTRTAPSPAHFGMRVAGVAGMLWWLFPGHRPEWAVWVNLGLWPSVVWAAWRLRPASRRALLAWLLTGLQFALGLLLISQTALWLYDAGTLPRSMLLWRVGLLILALLLVGLSLLTWSTLLPWLITLRHGLMALVLLLALGQAAGWARVIGPPAQRLWHPVVTSPQIRLLERTWNQWSLWVHGWPHTLQGISTVVERPELRWTLHRARHLDWLAHPPLNPDTVPQVVLTPGPQDPAHPGEAFPFRIQVNYRGQDFLLRERLQPFASLRDAWLWVFHLQPAPTTPEFVVFWLRADLFLHARR